MSWTSLRDPRTWLIAAALALSLLALVAPHVLLNRDAYDVVAVIDITTSMNTRDATHGGETTSRLAAAKSSLRQLLAKLPTQVLEPPRVQAEPREVNLGLLQVGSGLRLEVQLANLGGRLLYGSIVSDCKWLALGEPPGQPQKLFQFGHELLVPVQVRGQQLRAGVKPLEGRLVVESNGGTATVQVRCEVPVKPFGQGVLAGDVGHVGDPEHAARLGLRDLHRPGSRRRADSLSPHRYREAPPLATRRRRRKADHGAGHGVCSTPCA